MNASITISTPALARLRAQNVAAHPLEHTIGQGTGYGFAAVAAEMAPQVALLRLAGGLRWAGATRAAVVAGRMAGAESELLGVRAGWQGLKAAQTAPRQFARTVGVRALFDGSAQGLANYALSDVEGHNWERVKDAAGGVNLVETSMAMYGLRPVGISVGSAAFQWSFNDGFQNVFDGSVSPEVFLSQAAIGGLFGYAGEGASHVLSKRRAYNLYHCTALRLGHKTAYPVWLGSYHLFRTLTPAVIGTVEEFDEGVAQKEWEAAAKKKARSPGHQQ